MCASIDDETVFAIMEREKSILFLHWDSVTRYNEERCFAIMCEVYSANLYSDAYNEDARV